MQPTPQKVRPIAEPREPRPKRPGTLGPALRIAISIVIVWHFTAVFMAALSIDSSSPLIANIAQRRPMQWYLDALYLNQGHSFFAPNVGPCGVVHYDLFNQAGQPMGAGDLPSTKEHWPRLRYHRHFMLSDQAPSGDDNRSKYWGRAHLEAYARQVLREHPDAGAVRLRHYHHWALPLEFEIKARTDNYGWDRAYRDFAQAMARNGVTIDEHGYQLMMEVTQRRSDLGPEEATQANTWQSGGRVDTANRWGGGPR
jgi:hypothetical protein